MAHLEAAISLCDPMNPELGYQVHITQVAAPGAPVDVLFTARNPATGAELRTYDQCLDVLAMYRSAPMDPMTKTYRATAVLTARELEALPKALEYIRVYMAHAYPWSVRDAAMTALGKMLDGVRLDLPGARIKTHQVAVTLSAPEFEALPKALSYVQDHMASIYPWFVRDAAMTALGKVLDHAQSEREEHHRS